MSNPINKSSESAASHDPLPEHWPNQQILEPVKPIWLPWPLAVPLAPLFCLFPKRLGAHFAESRWTAAIVAHLFWMIYALACAVSANEYTPRKYTWAAYFTGQTHAQKAGDLWPDPTLSEMFRAPLAEFVLVIKRESESSTFLFEFTTAIVLVELSVLLLAAVLMPFATSGERGLRLYSRCLKLTLWSTTSFMLLALGIQAIDIYEDQISSLLGIDAEYYIVFAFIALSIWIWLRSASRYAGPPEGPGWQLTMPCCEKCGYILTGLTTEHSCPECGLPVTESMPQNRKPTAYARASNFLTSFPAFWATCYGAILGRGFFKKLAIHNQHRHARRFAIRMCIICGILGYFVWFSTVKLLPIDEIHLGQTWEFAIISFSACITIIACLLVLLGLLILLVSRFCLRPIKHYSTVIFYCSSWLLPFSIAAAFTLGLSIYLLSMDIARKSFDLWIFGEVDAAILYVICSWLLPIAIMLIFWHRISKAIQQTRFANA